MKLNLVKLQTADKLILPGLFYEPDEPTKRAAIYLHGMGSSVLYQVDPSNELGLALTKKGISYLTFNNRGAELIKYLRVADADKKVKAGTTFELIKDCLIDIEAAIKFLKARGYNQFYLVGHSTGANKICVYNFYKPHNPISKYVLLAGGDDTGLAYEALGARKFTRLPLKAQTQVKKGHGEKLVEEKIYSKDDEWFSYQAAYDILNPDGDYNAFPFKEYMDNLKISTQSLFRHYRSIKKPTLVVYGSDDEYCYGKSTECLEILKANSTAPEKFVFKTIEGADHVFRDKWPALAKTIAEWLDT